MPHDDTYEQHNFKKSFADFFLAMLRAVRSPHDENYRRTAEWHLGSWLNMWREKENGYPLNEVIDAALAEVGFQKELEFGLENDLQRVARASITYLSHSTRSL